MNTLFSIITITKNSKCLFNKTAKSIQCQTFLDYEWIVVDGSDQENSVNIVDESIVSSALLIRGQDRNISHAWNLGIAASRGSYILLLNAGDTYTPDFLQVCSLNVAYSIINCGSAAIIDESGNSLGLFTPKPKALWRGMHIPHNWMCVPRHFYDIFGLYSEMPHAMDYEWVRRVYANFGSSAFVPLPIRSYGTYLLGGHSDKYYFEGLMATKEINQSFGMPRFLATSLYAAYAAKKFFSI